MLIVAALVIIAFAYLYNNYDPTRAAKSGEVLFNVDGESVTGFEAAKLRRAYGRRNVVGTLLAGVTPDSGLPDARRFVGDLYSAEFDEEKLKTDQGYAMLAPVNSMVQNVFLLRHAAKKMGVQASPEEARKLLQRLPSMQTTGEFDPQKQAEFTTTTLSANGMNEGDLLRILQDIILYDKISELVEAGIEPSVSQVNVEFQKTFQKVSSAVVEFRKEDIEKTVEVTEEELKKAYEEDTNAAMSAERRKIQYVLFKAPEHPSVARARSEETVKPTPIPTNVEAPTPVPIDPDAPKRKEPAPPDTGAPVPTDDSTPDGGQDDDIKLEPGPSGDGEGLATDPISLGDPLTPASDEAPGAPVEPDPEQQIREEENTQHKKNISEFRDKVDTFSDQLYTAVELRLQDPAKALEALSADGGWETVTTDFFPADSAPEALAKSEDLIKDIFARSMDDPVALRPIQIGGTDFIVYRLVEIEKPKKREFADAREDLLKKLKTEKTVKTMREKAKQAKVDLEKAMNQGKGFKEAAKDLELSVQEFPATSVWDAISAKASGWSPSMKLQLGKMMISDKAEATRIDLIASTATGDISEPGDVMNSDIDVESVILTYVESREDAVIPETAAEVPPTTPNAQQADTPEIRRGLVETQVSETLRRSAFPAWISEERKLAGITLPDPPVFIPE